MKKEDFEQRGWRFIYEYDNVMNFRKGDIWKDDGQGAFLSLETKKTEYENMVNVTYIVTLTTTDSGFNQDGPNHSVKFNGEFKTMNEFDMICKMIRLKI